MEGLRQSLRSTFSVLQDHHKLFEICLHLYNPVSSLQSPVLSSGTVLQDVLDENPPHHLPIAQPAAHPSTPDDADAQRLAWLPEELHSEAGTDNHMLDCDIPPLRVTRLLICESIASLTELMWLQLCSLTSWVGSSCCKRHSPPPLHPHAQGGWEHLYIEKSWGGVDKNLTTHVLIWKNTGRLLAGVCEDILWSRSWDWSCFREDLFLCLL